MRRALLLLVALTLVCPLFAKSAWFASWIWNNKPTRNVYFRKVIVLDRTPIEAKLAITADNIYTLFINGQKVGHDEDWPSLETYDILPYLKRGKNIIAVEAIDPGPDVGALLAEGSINFSDGSFILIKTDRTWRMMPGEAEEGWEKLDFDDSCWLTPVEIGSPPIGPWGGLPHPEFTPKVDVLLRDFKYEGIAPGSAGVLSFKVSPKAPLPLNGPVGVRFSIDDSTVYVKYQSPLSPLTDWEPGKVYEIVFDNLRLPEYALWDTKYDIELLLPSAKVEPLQSLLVGKKPDGKVRAPSVVKLESPAIEESCEGASPGFQLDVILTWIKGPKPELLQVRWMQGDVLWFVENIPIPEDIQRDQPLELTHHLTYPGAPEGRYEVKFALHKGIFEPEPRYNIEIDIQRGINTRPLGYGTFVDRWGVPHHWYISHTNTLVWDGKPYIPVGGMYLSFFVGEFNEDDPKRNERNWEKDREALKKMKEAGISDIYLNPCCGIFDKPAWVWQRFFELVEELGFCYGWQVTTHVKELHGLTVSKDEFWVREPEGNRYSIDIYSNFFGKYWPDNKVYYAAFNPDTGELIEFGEAQTEPLTNGLRAYVDSAELAKAGAHIHFIPEVVYNPQSDMHDYWNNIDDEYLNKIKAYLQKVKLGENFRCFIDPLDNEQSLRTETKLIPFSAKYRQMFADWLRARYTDTKTLKERWALEDELSFLEAAYLIPVSPNWAINWENQKAYRYDLNKSEMWYDIITFRDYSIRDYNNIVADVYKSVHDVPVVLKLTDLNSFTNDRQVGGFDGVGMEAYGEDGELVRGCGGGVYSRAEQASRTIWCLITETNMATPFEELTCYRDPLTLMRELSWMVEIGAKGVYVFFFNPAGVGFSSFNLFNDPRQFYWLGAYAKLLKESDLLNYKPVVEYMMPCKFVGMDGFLKEPPDFYCEVPSQSIRGHKGMWVVPASVIPPTGRLIFNLEDEPATRRWGYLLEDALAQGREVAVVGLRRNLGALSIDEYYTEQFEQDENGVLYQILRPTPTSTILARTSSGKIFALRDGNLLLYAKGDWENSIKEVASPKAPVDFIVDVLGSKILDLGDAFQAIQIGKTTYIWQMVEGSYSLKVKTNDYVSIKQGDGSISFGKGEIPVKMAPNAQRPLIIEGSTDIKLIGTGPANRELAKKLWDEALALAQKAGIKVPPVVPEQLHWTSLLRAAKELKADAEKAMRTTHIYYMGGNVKVDGKLGEWAGLEPLYLNIKVGKDFDEPVDYKDAQFYLGWDEENLYIAAHIKDEAIVNNYTGREIWNGDAIEVFIETHIEPDKLWRPGYDDDTYHFLFAPTNAFGKPDMASVGNPKLPRDYQVKYNAVAAEKTSDGYNIECAINYREMGDWHPVSGAEIGFTVALDDSDSGDRTAQYLWSSKRGAFWDRRVFARAVLIGGK